MATLDQLVVYLPGIAGSRLRDPESDEARWSTATIPRTLFDPARIDIDRELIADDLMPDLAVVQALPRVPQFRSLIRQLVVRV